MNSSHGISGQPAPEFRFDNWIANVAENEDLRFANIAEPFIYLYNFQSWCPGCHSHGFPTMKAVKEHFEKTGKANQVRFIAVQTVFEGHDTNTAKAAIDSLERHGLTDIALGHDSGHPPTIMMDYQTGGTPWIVLIGPERKGPDRTGSFRTVLGNGFQADAQATIEFIENYPTERDAATSTQPTQIGTRTT